MKFNLQCKRILTLGFVWFILLSTLCCGGLSDNKLEEEIVDSNQEHGDAQEDYMELYSKSIVTPQDSLHSALIHYITNQSNTTKPVFDRLLALSEQRKSLKNGEWLYYNEEFYNAINTAVMVGVFPASFSSLYERGFTKINSLVYDQIQFETYLQKEIEDYTNVSKTKLSKAQIADRNKNFNTSLKKYLSSSYLLATMLKTEYEDGPKAGQLRYVGIGENMLSREDAAILVDKNNMLREIVKKYSPKLFENSDLKKESLSTLSNSTPLVQLVKELIGDERVQRIDSNTLSEIKNNIPKYKAEKIGINSILNSFLNSDTLLSGKWDSTFGITNVEDSIVNICVGVRDLYLVLSATAAAVDHISKSNESEETKQNQIDECIMKLKRNSEYNFTKVFGIESINKMNRILEYVDIYHDKHDRYSRLGRRWVGEWRTNSEKQISINQAKDLFAILDWTAKFITLIEYKEMTIPTDFRNFLRPMADSWIKETNDERLNRRLDDIEELEYYELVYLFIFIW